MKKEDLYSDKDRTVSFMKSSLPKKAGGVGLNAKGRATERLRVKEQMKGLRSIDDL